MDLDLSQARQTFMTESSELLQEMENSLLALENSPDDQDVINSLFRSAHTIKGSSGILGMGEVEKFTHFVESLLSKVRDNEIKIAGGIIEVLLECRDHIVGLIELADTEGPLPEAIAKKGEALAERLNSCMGLKKESAATDACGMEEGAAGRPALDDDWHISLRFGKDVFRNGMDPSSFIKYLTRVGETTDITTIFDNLPEAPQMDPESCYLGFEIDIRSSADKKTIEDVFEFVKEDCDIRIQSRSEACIQAIGRLPEEPSKIGDILVNGGALKESEVEDALNIQRKIASGREGAQKPKLGEILVAKGMAHPEVIDAALEKQKKAQAAKLKESRSIRIDADKLDILINLVGELVISTANIDQHAKRIEDGGLTEASSILARLAEEIRDNTMKVRMVPIGETFNRFNRVVRDIGRDIGKEIELAISGGETELDKTVVERINDPLMHLVRNAADHGIEKPEARAAAGKPAKGAIGLNAYHDAGSIVIEVTDDGKGLNRTRILEKAMASGLVSQGQTLKDNETLNLIFEPGFSTAEEVTKLSGRGVGMDVVKRNIEALRGTVDIESEEGKGTTIRIRLPLTLAIIDGFMVGIDDSPYIIPLDMVVECVELPEAERLEQREQSYINLRGEVLPYIRLRHFFEVQGETARHENIVIVQYAGQKVGLVVDELFGEMQAVIKSLGKVYKDVKGISGATILGNGRVALIIDIPRLMQAIEVAAA